MSDSLILPTYEQVRSEVCKRSLYEFVLEFWDVVEPGRQFRDNWHIKVICDHLEAVSRGDIKRLIINIPPRHMKSLICGVFWPVWTWIENPEHRWLCTSYAQTLSTRDAIKSRRLIQSDKFNRWYGESFKLSGDQNQKQRYENDKTGYRIAASVGGQLTGDGGDTILVDDAHNVKEAESDAVRESTIEWFDQSLRTRLNDPDNGAIVIIMQRVHSRDLVGHLIEKDKNLPEDERDNWEVICLPARYEEDHPNPCNTSLGLVDPRTEEGELLWPSRIGESTLKKLEGGLGAYAVAGQLQQRPSPKEGGIIKKEWFRWYQRDKLPENNVKFIQSWDLAFKKVIPGQGSAKGSDFIAGLFIGFHEGNLYIIDGTNRRMSYPETKKAVIAMKEKYPETSAIYVEDKANGPAIVDDLKGQVSGMVAINPGKDSKESRVQAGSAYIESGQVFLPVNHPISDMIVEQATTFPNAANDDLVDALTQAILKLLGKKSLASLYQRL